MAMEDNLTILVTGASGNQGGEVARQLLAHGHQVRALTRRPENVKILELEESGAQIVQGDFEDNDSLRNAMEGVDGVFAMATMMEKGPEGEVQHGMALADMAKELGIKHYVYSSVQSANKKTGIPHFESKAKVENYIHDLNIPHTIIRPVFFMENYLNYNNIEKLKAGRFESTLTQNKALQMIAVKDLAAFVVSTFENRAKYLGRDYDLAGDELNPKQIALAFSNAMGTPISYHQQIIDDIEGMSDDYLVMLQWLQSDGYSVNIKGLHKTHPEIAWHSFQNWLSEIDWNQMSVTPDT